MQRSYKAVRRILQLAAAATFIIGLGTLLLPEIILEWFDSKGVGSSHFVRFIGTALIGFTVSNWLYSKATPIAAVLPGLYGNLTSLVLAIGVDLVGLITGVLSPASWLIVALHAGFAVAFSYGIWLIKYQR